VSVSFRYLELKTAMLFGKLPHEWDRIDKGSRAEAIAFVKTKEEVEQYQYDEGKNK